MKRLKLLLCLAMAVCLLGSLNLSAFAEGSGEYQYTVRLYEGYYGESGQTSRVIDTQTVRYGENVAVGAGLNQNPVGDGKYAIRGVKEAGKDSSVIYPLGYSLRVTEDVDYVVAYGIAGSMVRYTVTYSDANGNPVTPEDAYGNPLPSSETFYGTPGDAVVVGFRQVPGYQPQAYNLRKTLSANEAENVFPFVYTPIPESAADEENPEGPATDVADVFIPGGAAPAGQTPEELIDLDDTPLGLLDMGKDAIENGAEMFGRLPVGARVGLILVDAVLIGMIVWLIINRKSKKKEQNT